MKLPVLSGAEVVKLLSKTGFQPIGHEGSHVILLKQTESRKFKPVVPLHKELSPSTLHSIIKQAGLTREGFLELYQRR